MSAPPPQPPSGPPEPSDSPSMDVGGIYIRWNDRLWQEQADGSYLVWDEESHTWERSTTQPPPQPGESRETKECPNCGKRVKATLRHCPYCEFGFEDRTRRPTAPTPDIAPPLRQKQGVPAAVVVGLVALLLVAAVGGFFLYQRNRNCENWKSAVAEITEARIDLQGLPRGTTEAELYETNEQLLAGRRPGGCE